MSVKFTENRLAQACAATVGNAALYVQHLNEAMDYYDINTEKRVAMFLAQVSHESRRLSSVEENLSYSAKRLMVVWPSRFPTLASTNGYAMNPKALANKVYGGRLGNVNPGDGWLYRGRGLKQLTGFANYLAAEQGLGMLLTGDNAARAATPLGAAWTAAWFWFTNKCNQYADTDNLEKCTVVINGGLIGFEDGNDWGLDDRVEMLEYTTAQLAQMPEVFA